MNEETFLSALRDNPADELTWQALADWLDENGQADRAELLRLTRRMLPTPVAERGDLPERYAALLLAGARPVVVERTNSLGMRFALVPAGRFLMGSPESEAGRQTGERRHEVEITRPFWLGVFPVTQEQYRAVTGASPSYLAHGGAERARVRGVASGLDDFPVEGVPWEAADAFCARLSETLGEVRAAYSYRLPTEAEWEHASRAGTSTRFHCGDRLTAKDANFAGSGLARTSAVGSYKPNAFGLHDLHGNVREWCADWYGEFPAESTADPQGASGGWGRVSRGGCWHDPDVFCRSACRHCEMPALRGSGQGFRAVLVPARR